MKTNTDYQSALELISQLTPINLPSTLQRLNLPSAKKYNINLYVKRDDLVSSQLPGNKLRKLLGYVPAIQALPKTTELLTMGGAYSSHIFAAANIANLLGRKINIIVRGQELNANSNSILKHAASKGAALTFVSRAEYAKLRKPEGLSGWLQSKSVNMFIVPEGGSSHYSLSSCAKIVGEIDIDFDYIALPVGTGGTLAGIVSGLSLPRQAVGYTVFKDSGGYTELKSNLTSWSNKANWSLQNEYHFGGFGARTVDLERFTQDIESEYNLSLNLDYTAKCLYGLNRDILLGRYNRGSTVVMVVTGGAPLTL